MPCYLLRYCTALMFLKLETIKQLLAITTWREELSAGSYETELVLYLEFLTGL